MSTNPTEETVRRATMRRAAEWQVRHADGDLTPEEKVRFLAWLRESPLNIQQYLRNARMTQILPHVLRGQTVDYGVRGAELSASDNIVEGPGARGHRWWTARAAGAIAALICIIAVAAGTFFYLGGDADTISVAHGDQRTVRLSDGSVIHLNSASRVRTRFDRSERLVELDAGQALFSVAPDSRRPFRVRVGTTEVLAIGTQFDVYRKAADTTVTVVEGKVAVSSDAAQGRARPREAGASVYLSAGEQIKVGSDRSLTKAEPVDTREVTAWTRREIIFRGRALGEVAQEYARYLDVPIVIDDELLSRTPVTGMFDAYEPGPFLQFLGSFEGVHIEKDAGAMHVWVDRPAEK